MDYIHADKNNKEAGNIAIYENGICTLNSALKHIKGRGNATWLFTFMTEREIFLESYYQVDHTDVPNSDIDKAEEKQNFFDKIADFFKKIIDFFRNLFKW